MSEETRKKITSWLDDNLKKFISRKLLVFLICLVVFLGGWMEPVYLEAFIIICASFIGGQSIIDAISAYRR